MIKLNSYPTWMRVKKTSYIAMLAIGLAMDCVQTQKAYSTSKIEEETITLEISNRNKKILGDCLDKLEFEPYHEPYPIMAFGGKKLAELLPTEFIDILKRIAEGGSLSLVHIKNLPVDVIPKGNDIEDIIIKKTKRSEKLILSFTQIMGCCLDSNPKEQNGRIIHNISPVVGFENTISSKGRNEFYLHTENPFEKVPPHLLLLMALEGDEKVETTYFPIAPFLSQLPFWVIENMRQPHYKFRSGVGLDKEEINTTAIIEENNDNGKIRFRLYQDMERITPLTKEAKNTLDYISDAFRAQKEIKGISLQKGEMIIFNNGIGDNKYSGIMHGRRGYVSRPRIIQRGFAFPQTYQNKVDIAKAGFQGKLFSNLLKCLKK